MHALCSLNVERDGYIDLYRNIPTLNGEKLSRCHSGKDTQMVPKSAFILLPVAKLVISNFQRPELLTSYQEYTETSWTGYK